MSVTYVGNIGNIFVLCRYVGNVTNFVRVNTTLKLFLLFLSEAMLCIASFLIKKDYFQKY